MDFAADAVLETITPPRQTTPRAPSAAESERPSFDDHLDAATREDEAIASAEKPAIPDRPREHNATDETADAANAPLGGEVAPVTPSTPQPAAEITSTVLVQLIADTTRPAQNSEAPQTSAAQNTAQPTAPIAPRQLATAAQAEAAASAQNSKTPESSATAAAPGLKPDAAKADVSPEKGMTPAPQAVQSQLSARSAQFALQTQPTPASPTPTVTAPVAAAADTVEALAATIAPTPPAPEHAARQPKAAPALSAAKADAAATPDNTAPAATATPRTNAKAAAPQNAVKDAIAFASLLDAPEAAPQQQASSTPAAAPASSTQTQHAVAEQRAAPAAHQVAREIVRKFDGGNTRFELRLDPPELGRVEVRLDVSRDHRVTAVIAADSPQALTELARHARDLEQMLQGAGLELSDSGLSFDLRRGSDPDETAEFTGAIGESAAPVEDADRIAARPLGYERWRGVRVDMMV